MVSELSVGGYARACVVVAFHCVRQLPDIQTDTVTEMFGSITDEFGLCKTILADSGTQFTSEQFRKKCREPGILLLFSSLHHNQANSLAEHPIGIIKAL